MLLILDTHALFHRAYHAIPPLTGQSGQPVNAVYGLASMVLKLIDEFSPHYFVAAHDRREPSFRHQDYVGYQVKRKQTDKALTSQIDLGYQLLQSFGIPLLSYPGFEADDVIGTLVAKLHTKTSIVIVTGDKDLTQLVTKQVNLYMPVKGFATIRTVTPTDVKTMLGVDPKQVVDYKALVGDSSDNYPGIPGIGPVAALKLLAKYQTLDAIYAHLATIEPQALQKKLAEGKEAAYMSQKLARIVTTVPLGKITLEKYKFNLKESVVHEFFHTLGFRSLADRLNSLQKRQATSNQTSLF